MVLVPALIWIVVGVAVMAPILTIRDAKRAGPRFEGSGPAVHETPWPVSSANRSFWWSTGWTGARARAIGFQFAATISLGSEQTLSFCCA
jgi:hypothetical protein